MRSDNMPRPFAPEHGEEAASQLQRDIDLVDAAIDRACTTGHIGEAWQRLKSRLTPDRERVQQVIEEMLDLAPTCEKEWDEQLRLWAAMLAAAQAQRPAAAVPEVPAFTTGHCDYHKQAGGCPLHNLSCGWPKCDRRPNEAHRAMLAAAERAQGVKS